jgi:hypothetical protein
VDATPDTPAGRESVKPEVVDAAAPPASDGAAPEVPEGEAVTQPTKLIRIASMVRQMLEEVRQAPLDEAGRKRLKEIQDRSVHELEGVLSPELRKELDGVLLPFTSDAPSESELRLTQAQLVGWLEGLFHGIQATLFSQQATAQSQLEEVRRRRMIEATQGGMPGAPPGPNDPPSGYL